MSLKGFSEDYYLSELLSYCQENIQGWEDKTVADILALAQEYNIDLEDNYLTAGWRLGLAPNRYFNPEEYILAWEVKHPGDTLDGVNPYEHYLTVGAAQDINPSNSFDESDYIHSVLSYYQQHSPAEWGSVTYEALKGAMASAGITALSFHIDYDIDESIFPPIAVPAGEAVVVAERITISIDAGKIGNPVLFDASAGSFEFVENPTLPNSVEISGFSTDDLIKVSQSPATDYFFTNDGSDVMISLNINGVVSTIKLLGVLEDGDVILDGGYDSFRAAVGFDAFV